MCYNFLFLEVFDSSVTLLLLDCYPDLSKDENKNAKLRSAGRFAQRIPAGVRRIPSESV